MQAEHIPVHLGSMPASVSAAIALVAGEPRPGEQVVLNDPFRGGTHLNDVTVVAPVFTPAFTGEELVGWVANRAHHADLGGMAPGSMPPDAVTIQQEGLRIPPVRFTPEVAELIVASSRAPDERRGDLAAQHGANVLGVERLSALVAQLGGAAPLREVVDYGERRMRAALRALPDGRYDFDDVLDSTGPRPEQQVTARIAVTVTIRDDTVTFDFAGTDAQRPGNVNAVRAVTVSAVAFALRYATDPTIPANGGAMRPVEVLTPPASIVAAEPPVAVGAGNVEVSQRVADVCLGALARAVPDRIGAAGQGTMNNVLIGTDRWVYYETIGGGQGGRPPRPGVPGDAPHPGMSGVHTAMTNTRDTPVEALERALPLRVRRSTLRRGSGGDGGAPGGDGIERELELLEPATVSLVTERRVRGPWGLRGGEPGAPGENWLLPGGDEAAARAAARQGHARRAGRRRRAHPHPRRRRLGRGGRVRGRVSAGGADADDLDRHLPAGALVRDRLARGGAHQRDAERRRHGENLVLVVAFLDGPDEVLRRLVVTLHADLDDGPGRDDVAGGVLDDDRVAQHLLELADPCLVVPLLVLGRVVVGVLPDVAVLARPFDPHRDLTAALSGPERELFLEPLVGRRRQMGGLHASGAYPRERQPFAKNSWNSISPWSSTDTKPPMLGASIS